jgi:uncharacterized 2Fe-2S/4Fe-4S cluster protein (DUF4445 family)
LFAQTKVSGIIVDKMNQPVPYANVVLRVESRVMSNEDGRFILSQKTLIAIIVTWDFQIERSFDKLVNYDFKVLLRGRKFERGCYFTGNI